MKKINTKDLVAKIERLTRAKMVNQEVVPLGSFRDLKKKLDPKVILVVEDDETMQVALKRILEQESYLVKMAADATELAKVLDDKAIDLLLLDIGLPWIDGFELGQILKEHKDLKHIPLIYISGHVTEPDLKRAFEIGASEFFQKPFEPEKLKSTIKHLLLQPLGPNLSRI